MRRRGTDQKSPPLPDGMDSPMVVAVPQTKPRADRQFHRPSAIWRCWSRRRLPDRWRLERQYDDERLCEIRRRAATMPHSSDDDASAIHMGHAIGAETRTSATINLEHSNPAGADVCRSPWPPLLPAADTSNSSKVMLPTSTDNLRRHSERGSILQPATPSIQASDNHLEIGQISPKMLIKTGMRMLMNNPAEHEH